MNPLDLLADARTALLTVTDRVFVPGQVIPDDDQPIIRIDLLGHTDHVYARDRAQTRRIQVGFWGASLEAIDPLIPLSQEAMKHAGFIPDGGGPLTDPDTGQVGYHLDYRRQ